ncbi:hypothetical protein OG905_19505 [Streptomyces sp. NBC_00322]|uniref:hypothetical protein n=1 Tax=Streptomyces sp. NBC_00322 TaxID=2975712 RepID=UPI002E2BC57F|nr:hypothetical protein [Streptomyces sp. NBC_00322]
MNEGITLASGTHGPPLVMIGVFVLAGLVAVWCGASWAFNVRGIAVRRAENIRQRHQLGGAGLGQLGGAPSGGMWAEPWYHRLLGAALTAAGLVLVVAGYALWHLR